MDSKPYVDFSEIESELLGMKVGRCNAEAIDARALHNALIEGAYDFCRVKTPAEDEYATQHMESAGLPVFYSGSIRRYRTPVPPEAPVAFINKTLVFEKYDGTQNALLRKMLDGTWGTYPLGYYRSPVIGPLLDKKLEMDCVFKYYRIHNLNRDYPKNSIMFMRDGDEYVGFFALNIIDQHLESHIGGILPPFQKGGYFLDMLNYIRRFCQEHNLGHFVFGARNENAQVQKIFQKFGFLAHSCDNVYHIPCFYGRSLMEVESFSAPVGGDRVENDVQRYGLMVRKANELQPSLSRRTHTLHYFEEGHAAPARMELRVPVATEAEVLLVLRLLDADGHWIGVETLRSDRR